MKYLLVPASGDPADAPALEAASRLAKTLGAHVVFLHVREDAIQVVTTMIAADVDGPIGSSELTGELEREGLAREERARLGVQTLCAAHGISLDAAAASDVSAEWASVIGAHPDTLMAWARTADLIVMGRDDRGGDALSQVLVEAGRPVLFVPTPPPPALLDRVVVAWNDTAEAARAVTAALPLIDKAGSVAVLTVGDGPDQASEASAARLADALRHHNAAVALTRLRMDGRAAGEVLLQAALADGATLLVMGGYSHSRLRQMVFGGFTRDILDAASLPVLIAH